MNQAGVDKDLSPARSAALLKEETTGGAGRRHGAARRRAWSPARRRRTARRGKSSLLMNALKAVTGVDERPDVVIDESAIEPICRLKTELPVTA